MKTEFLIGASVLLNTAAQCQSVDKGLIKGSWLNANVIAFYEGSYVHACDTGYIDDDKFVPLHLGFESENRLKVAFRIEQKIYTYRLNRSSLGSFSITNGSNTYTISLINNTIALNYNNNIILFKKVSDYYYQDVFAEYIKNAIFKKKSYKVSYFTDEIIHSECIVARNNFEKKLKKIFQCNYIDIVPFSSIEFQGKCLPAIALYYDKARTGNNPRVLGILTTRDKIEFVDKSGFKILGLNE